MAATKRIFILILMILLCFSLAACGEKNPDEGDPWVGYQKTDGVFGDQGYYYQSDSCLYFMDPKQGANICLCSKISCPHNTTGDDVAIINCEAYIPSLSYYPYFFWNGGLYYITDDEYGLHLNRRNATGQEQSEIGILCSEYIEDGKEVAVYSYICAGGYLYYMGEVCMIKDGNVVIELCIIRRVNLKSGREEELVRVPGHEYLTLWGARAGGMIYQHYELPEVSSESDYEVQRDKSPSRVIQWNGSEKNSTVLLEKTLGDGLTYKGISDGKLMYSVKESEGFVVHQYDLETGKDEKLFENSSLFYINDIYALSTDPQTEKRGLFHIPTEQFLPNIFSTYTLRLKAISTEAVVLSRNIPYPDDPYAAEKEIFFYILLDDLADGIQQEDVTDFYIKHFS